MCFAKLDDQTRITDRCQPVTLNYSFLLNYSSRGSRKGHSEVADRQVDDVPMTTTTTMHLLQATARIEDCHVDCEDKHNVMTLDVG